jgi:hypothetical protein
MIKILRRFRRTSWDRFRFDLIFIFLGAIALLAVLFFQLYKCLGSDYCSARMAQKGSLPWYDDLLP